MASKYDGVRQKVSRFIEKDKEAESVQSQKTADEIIQRAQQHK